MARNYYQRRRLNSSLKKRFIRGCSCGGKTTAYSMSAMSPIAIKFRSTVKCRDVPIAYIRLLAVLLTNKQIIEPAKDSAADQAVNQRVDRPDNNRTHASARMIAGVD